MTIAADSARNFSRLLKEISKSNPVDPPVADDPLEVMVLSFLMWDSTTAKATAAYKRVRERVVDFNDLRVSMPHEIVAFIGPRYPAALERAERLRAVLRHTYHREHEVSLGRLNGLGKREVKKYLRSLDGISPYVADRVTLLCFDGHCIPADERLRRALIKHGICVESTATNELASWLTRQVKAADAASTHTALQQWSDRVGSSVPASSVSRGGATGRRPAAKTVKS